jgi:hypothetical protein
MVIWYILWYFGKSISPFWYVAPRKIQFHEATISVHTIAPALNLSTSPLYTTVKLISLALHTYSPLVEHGASSRYYT